MKKCGICKQNKELIEFSKDSTHNDRAVEYLKKQMIKQVILIRKDLNMRKGKMAVQAAHASMQFIIQNLIPTDSSNIMKIQLDNDIEHWLNTGMTKICLQVDSLEEMMKIYEKAKIAGLKAYYINDLGKTEFKGVKTLTSICIGPDNSDKIDAITGHLKLY